MPIPRRALIAAAGALAALPAAASAAPRVRVLAGGLDQPRHLAVTPNGSVWVTEAGRGGQRACFDEAEGPTCVGATGKIRRIDARGRTRLVVRGLPSTGRKTDGGGSFGPHGIFVRGGTMWATIGGPGGPKRNGKPVTRAQLAREAPVAAGLGRVVRLGRGARVVRVADAYAYEQRSNPDRTTGDPEVNSNAVDVLADGRRLLVVDAGGNRLEEVVRGGRIRTLALFRNRPISFGGATIPMQAVPTAVAKGPDGAYYVSQLTGFPFPAGGARIYRVNPRNGRVSVYASGFTNAMDLAFDRRGNLWVLEIDANGLLNPPDDGAIFRVPRGGGTPTRLALPAGTLTAPGGIDVGPGGALYVSDQASAPGQGRVLKITR